MARRGDLLAFYLSSLRLDQLFKPLLDDCLHHRILEIAVDLPVWIVGLNRQNHYHFLFGVI